MFVTACSIWYNRNQVVHESQGLPSTQIWNFAQWIQSDYKEAVTINLLRQQPPKVGWATPPPGVYKINVDGATFEDGRPSGVGVVIKDCRGMVVAASAELLSATYGVEDTEALAAEEGMLLASQMMLTKIILESDSLLVVQATSYNSLHGDLSPIIQGILDLLSSVDNWKVKYMKRDYNRVAHELAKLARDSRTTQF